jgi:hypothetical protein
MTGSIDARDDREVACCEHGPRDEKPLKPGYRAKTVKDHPHEVPIAGPQHADDDARTSRGWAGWADQSPDASRWTMAGLCARRHRGDRHTDTTATDRAM